MKWPFTVVNCVSVMRNTNHQEICVMRNTNRQEKQSPFDPIGCTHEKCFSIQTSPRSILISPLKTAVQACLAIIIYSWLKAACWRSPYELPNSTSAQHLWTPLATTLVLPVSTLGLSCPCLYCTSELTWPLAEHFLIPMVCHFVNHIWSLRSHFPNLTFSSENLNAKYLTLHTGAGI